MRKRYKITSEGKTQEIILNSAKEVFDYIVKLSGQRLSYPEQPIRLHFAFSDSKNSDYYIRPSINLTTIKHIFKGFEYYYFYFPNSDEIHYIEIKYINEEWD